MKHWNKYVNAKKLKEAKGPKIKPGDIKKGMFVWFEDKPNSAIRVKVKHIHKGLGGPAGLDTEHYVTNKGTFSMNDVVGY